MGLLGFLSSREKKVQKQKLQDEITKLSDELTTDIMELSEKTKKLNELKEKYKQMESEAETPDENESPEEEKSFFSNWFTSSKAKVPPPPSKVESHLTDATAQLSEDSIDPDMLSAASTASPEQQGQSSSIDQSLKDISQTDTPQIFQPNYNNISSNSVGSDAMKSVPVPAPAPAPVPAPAPAPAPSLSPDAKVDVAAVPTTTVPIAAGPTTTSVPIAAAAPIAIDAALKTPQMSQGLSVPLDSNEKYTSDVDVGVGGKKRKKSKRSKKTIRKSYKKLNKATKKQKANNANNADSSDAKAREEGLAQALLQEQGQS
jgi:hypothetical protein